MTGTKKAGAVVVLLNPMRCYCTSLVNGTLPANINFLLLFVACFEADVDGGLRQRRQVRRRG